jgi:hypothetical protein
MEDLPDDLMPVWQLVLMSLGTLLIVPVMALYAAVRGVLTPPPRMTRVTCPNCGYRMPAIERHCPECRSNVR